MLDRFCCYFLNLLYDGSSIIDSEFGCQDLIVSFRNENTGDDFSYRREDRRKDKRMNWSLSINDVDCHVWLQYQQYQGISSLIPLPSVFLTVRTWVRINSRFMGLLQEMKTILVLRFVCWTMESFWLLRMYGWGGNETQMIENVSPVQHNHKIRIEMKDTQVTLEQLMVDAAIRVFGDIRWAWYVLVTCRNYVTQELSKIQMSSSDPFCWFT